MAKVIVCVDMDAFFASVEQRDNPALRDKPIAVTGGGERTVITTSSVPGEGLRRQDGHDHL